MSGPVLKQFDACYNYFLQYVVSLRFIMLKMRPNISTSAGLDNETAGHIIFDCAGLTCTRPKLFGAQTPTELLQNGLISRLLKLTEGTNLGD